jgi:hypothetical protein
MPAPQVAIVLGGRKNEKGEPIPPNFESGCGKNAFEKIKLLPPRKDMFINRLIP